MHPLDNAIWHALHGPQRDVAELRGTAARYEVDVAPFSALPDVPTPDDWAALADLIGDGGLAVIFRGEITMPDDWVDVTVRATANLRTNFVRELVVWQVSAL